MSINKDGIMVILSSPSGAGKTTLVKLIAESKDFNISISHTTRKPRVSEINGKDYYFTSNKKFQEMIEKNEFLEYAKVFNNFYGTTRSPVIEKLKNGKNVIFDIDWQGTEQIKTKKLEYKLITFFVLPPSRKALFDRLSNRDMKDKLTIELRMKEFKKDVLHWKNYDYVVINDNLENCFSEIAKLIDSEINGLENQYNKEIIKRHINQLTS
jgi:guanylate kinase|tara:strand:+ start:172 stop:804 length:633 start_codon:yes stop_codon:yes gene_type:complete